MFSSMGLGGQSVLSAATLLTKSWLKSVPQLQCRLVPLIWLCLHFPQICQFSSCNPNTPQCEVWRYTWKEVPSFLTLYSLTFELQAFIFTMQAKWLLSLPTSFGEHVNGPWWSGRDFPQFVTAFSASLGCVNLSQGEKQPAPLANSCKEQPYFWPCHLVSHTGRSNFDLPVEQHGTHRHF